MFLLCCCTPDLELSAGPESTKDLAAAIKYSIETEGKILYKKLWHKKWGEDTEYDPNMAIGDVGEDAVQQCMYPLLRNCQAIEAHLAALLTYESFNRAQPGAPTKARGSLLSHLFGMLNRLTNMVMMLYHSIDLLCVFDVCIPHASARRPMGGGRSCMVTSSRLCCCWFVLLCRALASSPTCA